MNSKVFNSLSILCLIAVVGIMSWRDMHPKTDAKASFSWGLLNYYADADITPAMLPDDNWPITVSQGEFSYTPDDKTVWTPKRMPPATIAQRQINLEFHFKGLPRNPAKTIKIIRAVTDEWRHKGDLIGNILLDYSPEKKPDLKAYTTLLKAAYGEFSKLDNRRLDRYIIFAGINTRWAESPQKGALKDLQDYSPQFLIDLPQVRISSELLSELATFKYNFILQFPAGTLPGDLDTNALKKLDFLTGVTLTLDPHKLLPAKEDKIGLFPKL